MEVGNRPLLVLLTALTVAATGCVTASTDDVESAGAGHVAPDATGIVTDDLDGMIEAAVATPAVSFNSGGTFSFPIQPGGNVTGFVLELVWDAAAPTNEELDLWVRVTGAGQIPPDPQHVPAPGPIAKATGPSVLRLALPADAFPDDSQYDVIVRAASPGGLAMQQPFTLHVTTFQDVPFDDAYSAVEGAEG